MRYSNRIPSKTELIHYIASNAMTRQLALEDLASTPDDDSGGEDQTLIWHRYPSGGN